MFSAFGRFIVEILLSVPPLFPRFAVAWLFSFVFLVLLFSNVKSRVRGTVKSFDEHLRIWAAKLRYRTEHALAEHTSRYAVEQERIALSWFFRFWTNFASAPSLSVWSVVIPFAILYRHGFSERLSISHVSLWLLPGFGYAGSMLLSFVIKRVFKRVRPPRPGKAFGYKLKDPSFPSGHSLTSFCFWAMFTLALMQSGDFSVPAIVLLALMAVSIIILTGLSRIYLGVHFPSDVLGGYTIGAVWCVAFYLALPPVIDNVLKGLFP